MCIIEIRYIEPTDNRAAISKIYEESWKYAYNGIIPQDYLNSIPEGQWVSNLDNPGRKTLICIDDDIFIGTSSFGKSRIKKLSDWGEIFSIYLLPDYMGRGYGKILLQAAISELEKMEYKNIFLWVLSDNIRARYFYERFGFLRTDDYLNDNIGGKELQEVRYIYKC